MTRSRPAAVRRLPGRAADFFACAALLLIAAAAVGQSGTATKGSGSSDGSYRFDLLASGPYTVTAKYPNPAMANLVVLGANSSAASQPAAKTVVKSTSIQLGDADVTDANIELSSPRAK